MTVKVNTALSGQRRSVKMNISGEYFYGNKVSEYGRKNGYVDYGTLAKSVNHVLNNDVIRCGCGCFETVNWSEEDDDREVFQWYITDYSGAEVLLEAGEMVLYNEELNMYLWGVTHFGTSWDHVLTNIRCNTGEV